MLQQGERVVVPLTGDLQQTLAAEEFIWAIEGDVERTYPSIQSTTPPEEHIPFKWDCNERQCASILSTIDVHNEYRRRFELRVRQRAIPLTGDLLSVIENWPNLPWNLHREAVRILRVEGMASLARRGGQRAGNGRLTFNRASSKVQEMVCRLLSLSPGFWDIDDSGANWAVCPHPTAPERGPWPAWAIAFDDYQELLEASVRESPSQQLDDSCGEFGSLCQCARFDDSIRRKARSLQRALDLAGVLVAGANDDGECSVELNDSPYGIGDSSASRDLIGALSELSRLPIALINLLPDRNGGWMKRRSQAVTHFELLDDQRVLVRISPDLAPTFQQFIRVFPTL